MKIIMRRDSVILSKSRNRLRQRRNLSDERIESENSMKNDLPSSAGELIQSFPKCPADLVPAGHFCVFVAFAGKQLRRIGKTVDFPLDSFLSCVIMWTV